MVVADRVRHVRAPGSCREIAWAKHRAGRCGRWLKHPSSIAEIRVGDRRQFALTEARPRSCGSTAGYGLGALKTSLVALDAPLGWPRPLAEAVVNMLPAHRRRWDVVDSDEGGSPGMAALVVSGEVEVRRPGSGSANRSADRGRGRDRSTGGRRRNPPSTPAASVRRCATQDAPDALVGRPKRPRLATGIRYVTGIPAGCV